MSFASTTMRSPAVFVNQSAVYRTFWNRDKDKEKLETRSKISPALVFLNVSIPLLIDMYEHQFRTEDKDKSLANGAPNFNLPFNETFDFIIVGAGTAGSILARRLSENFTVLLLEAGGDPPPMQSVTTNIIYSAGVPSIHWIFKSTRQRYSGLSTKGILTNTGGKMLGGSGSHNNVQYERGHPYDYDNWANVTGDDTWKYKNVLKYFLKAENYHGQFSTTSGQHATGGLIDVEPSKVTFRHNLWFDAGAQLGFKVNIDANGPQVAGFMPVEYNRNKNGTRSGAYVDYVKPIEGIRDNLTVRRYSVASEIIFDGKKATGVRYERHGIPQAAFASKDVIISAGAYISPVLLMRSGIGPKDQLDKANIKSVAILPVGYNLQAHVRVLMPAIKVDDKSVFTQSWANVSFNEYNNFVETGQGFFSAFTSLHEAYIASKRAATGDQKPDWPDIQIYFGHEFTDQDILTCHVNLNRPRSQGRITLNTTATKLEDALIPVLDYNFFDDGTDYDVMIEGIEQCIKIVETTAAFQTIGARFSPRYLPECKYFAYFGIWNRHYWRCYIQYKSTTNGHLSGANRMGKADDPQTVVDTKFRVRGISHLRVVDASIMPFITNANINAAVMTIAEKAADVISSEWVSQETPKHE